MSKSSDSDAEQLPSTSRSSAHRLGKCEVCNTRDASYTCPKCEVKTCCVDCVNIHKRELDCDGVRDRTKFIRLKDFTNSDLLSDYRLLEECARFVHSKKRDEKKKFTRIDKELPIHLYKLRNAARNRGTALQFLTQNFTRHKANTTFYDWKTNVISWRVEWLFPNATPQAAKFVDERCPEVEILSELLDKYLSPNVDIEGSNALGFYHSAGFSGVKVLLKAEKVQSSSKKYFELDPEESLADNLAGKCIVEYPVICVVLKDHAVNFDIITSDDEFDYDQIEDKKDENPVKQNVQNAAENSSSESQVKSSTDDRNSPVRSYGLGSNGPDRPYGLGSNGPDRPYGFGSNGPDRPYGFGSNGPDRPYGFGRGRGQNRRGGFARGHYRQNGFNGSRHKRNHNRELLTERVAKEKKLEIQKEIKAEKKKKPKNLLFTTGYSSDESLSDSDDDKDVKLSKTK